MLQHSLFGEARDRASSPQITFENFPTTRYQGSKRKMLKFLWKVLAGYEFRSALDLYSGTASVSLLMRAMGKSVTANDYLKYNQLTARLLLSLDQEYLWSINIEELLEKSFDDSSAFENTFSTQFDGIYFKDFENREIDIFCANLGHLSERDRDLMTYLMGQAMLMKRPYNLFHRANLSMRLSDVPRSFGNAKTWEGPFQAHIRKQFIKLKKFAFQGPAGTALNVNTKNIDKITIEPDLVYLDPPYLNPKGIPVDYTRYYHLLDGLIDYSLFATASTDYSYRPILMNDGNWTTRQGALREIENVGQRWPKSILAISYRGDGVPSIDELKGVLTKRGYDVQDHVALDYKYALSHVMDATEDLLVAIPAK